MRAAPLTEILERFGAADDRSREGRESAKQALVKAVQALVKKGELLDDEFSDKGIERVSNRKLLRLLDLAERVQSEHGSRTGLVDGLVALEGRDKDAGYREHLEGLGLAALVDRYEAAQKRDRAKK